MSASRRCSTGWSAGSWRWSTTLPGVTRDRREGEGHIADLAFRADRHGRARGGAAGHAGRPHAGADRALARRCRCGAAGDRRARRADRRPIGISRAGCAAAGKPVVLVANKAEGRAALAELGEAYALGLGDPVPISAAARRGAGRTVRAAAPFAAGPETRRADDGGGREPRRSAAKAAAARDRRPPECRQIDPGQPADRRRARADRPRAGHHPRRDRDRVATGAGGRSA